LWTLNPYRACCPDAAVTVSLCRVDEAHIADLDINAPSARERLDLVRELVSRGVDVTVSASPWTKGDLVLRDIDLFLRCGRRGLVTISVASTSDDLLRQVP
jgi:DNA repair photolyase